MGQLHGLVQWFSSGSGHSESPVRLYEKKEETESKAQPHAEVCPLDPRPGAEALT